MRHPSAVQQLLELYPRIYFACHARHVRDPESGGGRSAHQGCILGHLDDLEPTILSGLAHHRGVPQSTMPLAIKHLRQMGSSHKSVYHGRRRWGFGQYFMGTHPLYMLGIAAYRMAERPWILGGINILLGYMGAWLKRLPRYDDPEFRRHLHRWQLGKLKLGWLAR